MKRGDKRRRLVAGAVVGAMVTALLGNMPALAGTGQDYRPPMAQREKPVAGRVVRPAAVPAVVTGRP